MTPVKLLTVGTLGVATTVVVTLAALIAPVSVLVPLMIALVIVAILNERIAWLAFFLCMTLTGVFVPLAGALAKPELFGLLFLILARAHGIRRPPFGRLPLHRVIVPASLLVISLFAASVISAPEPPRSLWIWLQLTASVASLFLILTSRPRPDVVIEAGTIAIGGVAAISVVGWLVATLGLIPPGTLGVGPDMRLIGFSIETNIFAAQMVGWLAVLWATRPFVSASRTRNWCVIIITLAVILAGTRSAWLAGLFLVFIATARRFWRSPWFLPSSILLGTAIWFTPGILQSMATGQDRNSFIWRLANITNTAEGTGAYRTNIYDIAWSEIQTYPRFIFGSGMNSYSQFHLIDATNSSAEYLGNVFLALWYDGGIIALATFSITLIALIAASPHRRRTCVVVIVIVTCAFATNIIWFQFAWAYIAVAILCSRAPRISRSENAGAMSHAV